MDNLEDFSKAYQELGKKLGQFAKKNNTDELLHQVSSAEIENQKLKDQIKQLKTELGVAQRAKDDYQSALFAKTIDEKTSLLSSNQKRLAKIISANSELNFSGLDKLEKQINSTLRSFNRATDKENSEFESEIKYGLMNLQTRVTNQRKSLLKKQSETRSQLSAQNLEVHQKMIEAPISKKAIREDVKNSKLESNLGLKIFSYIGIFFIFLAVISLGTILVRYINNILSMPVKGGLLFLVPLIFLVVGQIMRKKNRYYFGLSLIGGGIGLFYIVVFINYFVMKVMPSSLAFGLLVLGSIGSIFLALIYKELAIAMLATVGGYIPVITYWSINGMTNTSLLIAELYIFLISLFGVLLYEKFHWNSHLILTFVLAIPWVATTVSLNIQNPFVEYLYTLIFLVLFASPVIIKIVKKIQVDTVQVWISVAALIFYYLFPTGDMSRLSTTLIEIFSSAIAFAMYWVFYKYRSFYTYSPEAIVTWVITNISIFLTIIGIPAIFGQRHSINNITFAVLALLYVFIWLLMSNNLMYRISAQVHLGIYFIVMLTSFGRSIPEQVWMLAIILSVYALILYRGSSLSMTEDIVLNSGIFINLLLAITAVQNKFFDLNSGQILLLFLILALLLSLWKPFSKYYLPQGLFVLTGVLVYGNNTEQLHAFGDVVVSLISNLLILVTATVFGYKLVKLGKLITTYLVLAIMSLFLLSTTILAYVNIKFDSLSIILDLLYAAVTFGFIFYGLSRGDRILRKVGLIATLIVMAKLILLDSAATTLIGRFISFLVFGMIALLISYLYQKALNRIEQKND
ncbi:MAG: DUF2339 domain-containing protein [Lactobacillaceae bacterium]|jgi:uncharacterized membrane protein|nr:DUF2339 domain-containing protein [Lactobacillaceae bacterium]